MQSCQKKLDTPHLFEEKDPEKFNTPMPLLPEVTITASITNQTEYDLTPATYGSNPDRRVSGFWNEEPENIRVGDTGTWKAVHGTPDLTVDIVYNIGGTGWSLRLHVKNPAIGSNECSAVVFWDRDRGGHTEPAKRQYECHASMPGGWDAKVTVRVYNIDLFPK